MRARVVRVFDTTGLATAFWGRCVGKTFKVVKIIARNDGDTRYLLDMGKDGIRLWYSEELDLIDDGVVVEAIYGR